MCVWGDNLEGFQCGRVCSCVGQRAAPGQDVIWECVHYARSEVGTFRAEEPRGTPAITRAHDEGGPTEEAAGYGSTQRWVPLHQLVSEHGHVPVVPVRRRRI